MQELNKIILLKLNSFLEIPFFEYFAIIFADLPIFFLPLFLVFMWIYYSIKFKKEEKKLNIFHKELKGNKYKKNLLFIFYSAFLSLALNLIFQQFFYFDRPETVLKGTGKLLLNHIPDASFPSDHAAVSFAFLIALFLANYKKTGTVFLVFVLFMNLSRVMLGVHWPFDIIGGAFVGIFSSFFVFKILKRCKVLDKFNEFVINLVRKIGL